MKHVLPRLYRPRNPVVYVRECVSECVEGGGIKGEVL